MLIRVFCCPIILYISAFIPRLNTLSYEGDRIGWMLLILSLPIVIITEVYLFFSNNSLEKRKIFWFLLSSNIIYIILTFPLGNFAEQYLVKTIGGHPTGIFTWALLFPISLLFRH
jgi:hypothetical protein